MKGYCPADLETSYKNHDNDPVDAGAVVSLVEIFQKHINTFYEQYLGYSTRKRHKETPDFVQIARRLNEKTPLGK